MEYLNSNQLRQKTRDDIINNIFVCPVSWQQYKGWDIYDSPVTGSPYSYDRTLECAFPKGINTLLDYSCCRDIVGLELMGPITLLQQLGCVGAAVELDLLDDYALDLGGDQVRINCDLRDLPVLDYSLDYVKKAFGISGFDLVVFRPVGAIYNLPQGRNERLYYWEYIANQLGTQGTAYVQIERSDHKQIMHLQRKLGTRSNVGIFSGKNHSGVYKFDAMRIERYSSEPIDLFSLIY